MGTFADTLLAALRREEARGRAPDVKGPVAPAMVDLSSSVAASFARADERPSWARVLGLPAECDEAAVRTAYRRRAFETHPDRPGGSHEAFLAVRRAHEEAIVALLAQGRILRAAPTPAATAYVAARVRGGSPSRTAVTVQA